MEADSRNCMQIRFHVFLLIFEPFYPVQGPDHGLPGGPYRWQPGSPLSLRGGAADVAIRLSPWRRWFCSLCISKMAAGRCGLPRQ